MTEHDCFCQPLQKIFIFKLTNFASKKVWVIRHSFSMHNWYEQSKMACEAPEWPTVPKIKLEEKSICSPESGWETEHSLQIAPLILTTVSL